MGGAANDLLRIAFHLLLIGSEILHKVIVERLLFERNKLCRAINFLHFPFTNFYVKRGFSHQMSIARRVEQRGKRTICMTNYFLLLLVVVPEENEI